MPGAYDGCGSLPYVARQNNITRIVKNRCAFAKACVSLFGMSNPERPSVFDELTKCSNEIYGTPLPGENATNYLRWLQYPLGEVWYAQDQYYMSPISGNTVRAQQIKVAYNTPEDDVSAYAVDMMLQKVSTPYELVTRTPMKHEVSYGHQTLRVIDRGNYTLERVRAYAESHNLDEHKLHAGLGALFDVLCIASGIKKPDQAVKYVEEPGVTRRQVLDSVQQPVSARVGVLSKLIDAALSRQIQYFCPDRRGELLVQGRLCFGVRTHAVEWESMPYSALDNVIARHQRTSQTRAILEELIESQKRSQ